MKKLLFFLLICLNVLHYAYSQTSNSYGLTQAQQEKCWEFIKQRYMPMDNLAYRMNPNPVIFKDTIFLQLENIKASGNEDLLPFIHDFTKELGAVIHRKIEIVNDSTKTNLSIYFGEGFKYHTDRIINDESGFFNKRSFSISYSENCSIEIREIGLQSLIVENLIFKYRNVNPNLFMDDEVLKNSILNNDLKYIGKPHLPYKPKFTDADKFILSRVYDTDFRENFKKFLYKHSTIREYMLYFYPSYFDGTMLFLAVSFATLLFFFSLKYLLGNLRKHSFASYILPTLILVNIGILSIILYEYLKTNEYHFSFLIFLMINVSFIGWFTSVYVVEKYLFKGLLFSKRFFYLRLLITIVLSCFFCLILSYNMKLGIYFYDYVKIFIITFVITFFRGLYLYLEERSASMIREKDVQISKLHQSKAEAEVAALHARINPHFLYNSLNSIAALAHSDPYKTEHMALSLSDLFRHNINRKNEATCSITEEVEAVKAYLEIEQIRFGDKMQFSINVTKETLRLQIPRNIIQPLVENAIKHGLNELEEKGIIIIDIQLKNENLEISVYDNGPDFPEGIVSGYGLQSIYDILHLSYENNALLNWENTPKKRVYIAINQHVLKE
ncbi:sensor histidine kinase [Zhouia sp. PK063]|uniref:sensor histidine kinase n=1 Tax=Zhouia sp. PK063 TaxID=3373602 RepID=UPI0037AA6426